MLSAGPAVETSAATGDGLPSLALPLGKEFDFGTRLQALTTTGEPSVNSATPLSMSSDGTVWAAQGSSLYDYNLQTGVWKDIEQFSGNILSISAGPVTSSSTYGTVRSCWLVIAGSGSSTELENLFEGGGETIGIEDAASLPGTSPIATVAAAQDGTVWVLDGSGIPFSYSTTSKTYTAEPTGGLNLYHLSVGSASDIWAIGSARGSENPTAAQFVGGEFQVNPYLNSLGGVETISASADGTVWTTAPDGDVLARPADPGTWSQVPIPRTTFAISTLEAASKYRALANVGNQLAVISYGVADQPATGYAPLDAGEQLGYAYINRQCGIAAPGGIRSLYADAFNLMALGDDFSTITDLSVDSPPRGVSMADWKAIRSEILTEIKSVQDVYAVFGQIQNLDNQIEGQATGILAPTAKLVELDSGQQGSTIGVVFGAVFEAGLAALAKALTGGASIAAAAIVSGLEKGITAATGANPDQAIETTYVNLATNLQAITEQTNDANSAYKSEILADPGRFLAVGAAVNDLTLYWPAGSSGPLAMASVQGFQRSFFQILMPLKWEIVDFEEFEAPWLDQLSPPSYDYDFVPVGKFNNGVEYGNLDFIHDSNSSDNPFGDPSPYPTRALLNQIYSVIGGKKNRGSLFSGSNGWLPVTDLNTSGPPPRAHHANPAEAAHRANGERPAHRRG